MDKISVNNGSIKVAMPEGFKEMTTQEILDMGGNSNPNNWVIRNEEKNLIINIGWKKVPAIGMLMKMKNVLANTQNAFKTYIPTYQLIENVQCKIGGEESLGFRYSLVAQYEKQLSEYMLVKHNRHIVSFVVTGPEKTFEEDFHIFKELLDTVEFV